MAYITRKAQQAMAAQAAAQKYQQEQRDREDRLEVTRLSWQMQNKIDLDEVSELMKRPDLWDETRAWLKNVYLWLKLDTGRTLTPYHRNRVRRIVQAMNLNEQGRPTSREEWERRKKSQPSPMQRRRRQQLPTWMYGDDSQLPKRPPSSHQVDSEEDR